MKHLLLLALCALTMTACADEKQVITFASLSTEAQTLMTQYINPDEVLLVTQEHQGRWAEYEVKMTDQSEWEFNAEGALEKVEIRTGIPKTLLPSAIVTYVHATFPQALIIEYSIDHRDEEVKLNNGIELTFDHQGKLLKTEID